MIYAFVTGHVGATLLVAIGLTAGVESGWTPAEITRAYSIAREAFGMRAQWARIEALDNSIGSHLPKRARDKPSSQGGNA